MRIRPWSTRSSTGSGRLRTHRPSGSRTRTYDWCTASRSALSHSRIFPDGSDSASTSIGAVPSNSALLTLIGRTGAGGVSGSAARNSSGHRCASTASSQASPSRATSRTARSSRTDTRTAWSRVGSAKPLQQ
nr:hypothetical protein [Amycolatopsis cihanbeyliensis]